MPVIAPPQPAATSETGVVPGTVVLAPRAGRERRRCPVCARPIQDVLSPSGRRQRGRPRVFCSERCRLGERRDPAPADPHRRRVEIAAFATAVRAAIAAGALSLRELEARLAAGYGALASSVATLSAWQTGSSSPPPTGTGRDRVLALERTLGVPTGDLVLLMPGGGVVPPPRPPGRAVSPAARRARLHHLLAALSGSQQVLPVELSKEHRLGRGRLPLYTRVAMRVRAVHDGVDRFWFVHAPDPRLRPTLVEGRGCRVEREVAEPRVSQLPSMAAPLMAAELVFDRALGRGERYDFSFLVQSDAEWDPPRPPDPVFRHLQSRPCEKLDLAVTFDRKTRPVSVLECRWRPRDLAEVVRRRPPEQCWQYRLIIDDPRPAGYGWRWEWAAGLDVPGDPDRRRRGGISAA